MYLEVSPAGSTCWFLEYAVAGVEKQPTPGSHQVLRRLRYRRASVGWRTDNSVHERCNKCRTVVDLFRHDEVLEPLSNSLKEAIYEQHRVHRRLGCHCDRSLVIFWFALGYRLSVVPIELILRAF